MRRGLVFALNALGWMMLFLALILGVVRGVGSDYELYYRLQKEADILVTAGISDADLLGLDERLSDYLFQNPRADMAFDNRELKVFGINQRPFNERELIHLRDCRKLISIATDVGMNGFLAVFGVLLVFCTGRKVRRPAPIWLASALILLPLAAFALWAAADFNSAFNFFHELLFTNDLWLLNPETDLLIRICPASMFAGLGLRIGARAAGILLGVPALLTLPMKLDKRKRKRNEIPEL